MMQALLMFSQIGAIKAGTAKTMAETKAIGAGQSKRNFWERGYDKLNQWGDTGSQMFDNMQKNSAKYRNRPDPEVQMWNKFTKQWEGWRDAQHEKYGKK